MPGREDYVPHTLSSKTKPDQTGQTKDISVEHRENEVISIEINLVAERSV